MAFTATHWKLCCNSIVVEHQMKKGFQAERLFASKESVMVWPGHRHPLSSAEDAILSTPTMNILRHRYQMGLAHLAFPLAEHSRFIHSLGTGYWASQMFSALTNANAPRADSNRKLIPEIEARLGKDVSLELVIRIYGLIHDLGLLPLGHTLRFQLGFDPEGYDFQSIFHAAVSQLADELRIKGWPKDDQESLLDHLAFAEAAASAPLLLREQKSQFHCLFRKRFSYDRIHWAIPALFFIHDLVHGTYSADLVDWTNRDLTALGSSTQNSQALIYAGAVLEALPASPAYPDSARGFQSPLFRYGVDCGQMNSNSGTLHRLVSMHRSRLEVIQTATYSRQKIVADEMLRKHVSILKFSEGLSLRDLGSPEAYMKLGDREFLSLLASALQDRKRTNFAALLLDGQVYDFGAEFKLERELPSIEEVEHTIARNLELDQDDVVVSISSPRGQRKSASSLVKMDDGEWKQLASLAQERDIFHDIHHLAEQYEAGKTITVFHRPTRPLDCKALRATMMRFIGDDG